MLRLSRENVTKKSTFPLNRGKDVLIGVSDLRKNFSNKIFSPLLAEHGYVCGFVTLLIPRVYINDLI